jgi:cysteinyl-tRNA synthetase
MRFILLQASRTIKKMPLLRLLLLTASSSMTAAAAFHLTSLTITRRVFSSSSSALLQSSTSSATAITKQLHLYNSLTRTKTPLVPIDNSNNNKVSMYTCGPTVYDSAHVGNFRAFLTYDILKRTLLYLGYAVDHICNLTDVDDKIIKKCNAEQVSLVELTTKYTNAFFDDLDALNIIKAREYPRATDHIDEMAKFILDLEANGLAYQSHEGSWYFSVSKQEGYGTKLVQLDPDQLLKGASVTTGGGGVQRSGTTTTGTNVALSSLDADEYDAEKEGVRDFCLWKAYKPEFDREDAIWDPVVEIVTTTAAADNNDQGDGDDTTTTTTTTTQQRRIGKGRPGWHLECSAMARKYLGPTIDIHAGGIDLKFPHHENEIAQSEGANSVPFCNCWVHNGFVNIGDEKMSKSKGNFLTLRKACPTAEDVRAYRYLVVSSQYRNPLSFTETALGAAKGALKRLDRILVMIEDALKENDEGKNDKDSSSSSSSSSEIAATVEKELSSFEAAIADDLSMPRASACLFSIVKAAEKEFKRVAKRNEGGGGDEGEPPLDLVGLAKVHEALVQMDQVFGIYYEVPQVKGDDGAKNESSSGDDSAVPENVMDLVIQRNEAKHAKDWELADSLRTMIAELGFVVKDVKGGDPIVSKL